MYSKVLFLGLGGAGQRHLRIFRKMLPNSVFSAYRYSSSTPLLDENFNVILNDNLESKYNIQLHESIEDAINNKPDLVVISTPTIYHAQLIKKFANIGSDIFVEKPGAISHRDAIAISEIIKNKKNKFFISFQRRFHPLVRKLRERITPNYINTIKHIEIKVNSYFPEWHPYEDYRDLYAAKSILGGGAIYTESHEIDLINLIFDSPNKIYSILRQDKKFNIDVEDSASIVLSYDNFEIFLRICFLEKRQERSIEIYSKEEHLFLDLNNSTMHIKNFKTNKVNLFEDKVSNEEVFVQQAQYFLNEFKSDNLDYVDAIIKNSLFFEEVKNDKNQ